MQMIRERRILPVSRRLVLTLAIFSPLLSLCGCGRAPSFNILGSFFPAWLVCIIAGIVLAAAFYGLFVRLQLESEIRPAIVVYPCLALFWAFTLWLIFFR
jgi:YtcA family